MRSRAELGARPGRPCRSRARSESGCASPALPGRSAHCAAGLTRPISSVSSAEVGAKVSSAQVTLVGYGDSLQSFQSICTSHWWSPRSRVRNTADRRYCELSHSGDFWGWGVAGKEGKRPTTKCTFPSILHCHLLPKGEKKQKTP
ncbi:Cartilage Oligomeric Matrix Protein [Manis pentadactyla]|nr:Cartilage Oligomeric Matrix Protein [Manis pentadactyla]